MDTKHYDVVTHNKNLDKMKLKLRNKEFCDGCDQLIELNTLAQHKRCKPYNKIMLPREDMFITNKGLGYLPRPDVCKKENEAEIKK